MSREFKNAPHEQYRLMTRLIGKRISIPGQFTGSVTVESEKVFEDTLLLRIRNQQGELHDAYFQPAPWA
jgi:hypothetical protein